MKIVIKSRPTLTLLVSIALGKRFIHCVLTNLNVVDYIGQELVKF